MAAKRVPLRSISGAREQPKVTRSEIRRVRWLGDDTNVYLDEQLLHNKRCMARCFIVMQKSLPVAVVAPLPPNSIAQPLQNLHVELTTDTLSGRYEHMVHQTTVVKEFRELFDCPLYV
jgi:hypothetical protein